MTATAPRPVASLIVRNDYRDYLERKGLKPLPPPHTEKKIGDWVLTGSGWVRVGEAA